MKNSIGGLKIYGIPDGLDTEYSILVKELVAQVDDILKNDQSFIGIYGSYPNAMCSRESDIDLVVGIKKFSSEIYKNVSKIITEYHYDNNLGIDNEVPLNKKLLVTYDDFYKGVNLNGFEIANNGEVKIDEIIKDKDFLESDIVKYRLIFYILTAPLIYSGNDIVSLKKLQNKGNEKLFLLMLSLNKGNIFTKKELLMNVLIGNNGNKGEMFLGYKNNYKILINHLFKTINDYLNFFIEKGVISEFEDDKYKINNDFNIKDFLNEF